MEQYIIRGIPVSVIVFGKFNNDPIVYVKEFSLETVSFSVEIEDAKIWSHSDKDMVENIASILSKEISTYVFFVINKNSKGLKLAETLNFHLN